MEIWQAIILGIVEGITEFLPISSTGHLTIVEKLMDLPIDDPAVTAFTAVIQVGAIAAVLVYFAKDIGRLGKAWFKGLFSAPARQEPDYKFAWYVIAGSLPICVVGILGKDLIKGPLAQHVVRGRGADRVERGHGLRRARCHQATRRSRPDRQGHPHHRSRSMPCADSRAFPAPARPSPSACCATSTGSPPPASPSSSAFPR